MLKIASSAMQMPDFLSLARSATNNIDVAVLSSARSRKDEAPLVNDEKPQRRPTRHAQ